MQCVVKKTLWHLQNKHQLTVGFVAYFIQAYLFCTLLVGFVISRDDQQALLKLHIKIGMQEIHRRRSLCNKGIGGWGV